MVMVNDTIWVSRWLSRVSVNRIYFWFLGCKVINPLLKFT